jgi:hypothetical protein
MQRLKEHIADVKHSRSNSAVYQHYRDTGHSPDQDHFTPLFNESKYFSRLNLETITIVLHQSIALNQQIPTHYGINAWIKFLRLHHTSAINEQTQFLQRKLATRKFRAQPSAPC